MIFNGLQPNPRPHVRQLTPSERQAERIADQLQRICETCTENAVDAWRAGKRLSPQWWQDRLSIDAAILLEDAIFCRARGVLA